MGMQDTATAKYMGKNVTIRSQLYTHKRIVMLACKKPFVCIQLPRIGNFPHMSKKMSCSSSVRQP